MSILPILVPLIGFPGKGFFTGLVQDVINGILNGIKTLFKDFLLKPLVSGLTGMMKDTILKPTVAAFTATPGTGGSAKFLQEPNGGVWTAIMQFSEEFQAIAFLSVILAVLAFGLLSSTSRAAFYRNKSFVRRALIVTPLLFVGHLWAWVLIYFFEFVRVISHSIMPNATEFTQAFGTEIAALGSVGLVAGIASGGAGFIIFGGLMSIFLLIFVVLALIGIFRWFGVLLLTAMFPISLVLWMFGGIDMFRSTVGEMGRKMMGMLFGLGFMPIPVVVSFKLGTLMINNAMLPFSSGGGGLQELTLAFASFLVGTVALVAGPFVGLMLTKSGSTVINTATKAGAVAAGGYVGGVSGATKMASRSGGKLARIAERSEGDPLEPGRAPDPLGAAGSVASGAASSVGQSLPDFDKQDFGGGGGANPTDAGCSSDADCPPGEVCMEGECKQNNNSGGGGLVNPSQEEFMGDVSAKEILNGGSNESPFENPVEDRREMLFGGYSTSTPGENEKADSEIAKGLAVNGDGQASVPDYRQVEKELERSYREAFTTDDPAPVSGERDRDVSQTSQPDRVDAMPLWYHKVADEIEAQQQTSTAADVSTSSESHDSELDELWPSAGEGTETSETVDESDVHVDYQSEIWTDAESGESTIDSPKTSTSTLDDVVERRDADAKRSTLTPDSEIAAPQMDDGGEAGDSHDLDFSETNVMESVREVNVPDEAIDGSEGEIE